MRRGRANEKLILEITGQRAAVEGMCGTCAAPFLLLRPEGLHQHSSLLVSPPSSETCGGSVAAAAGARGGGVGGVAGGGSLVGVTRVSGPAALAAAAGGGLSGIGGTGCVTGRSHGA